MADIIVVAVILVSAIIGYKRGFIKSISKLLCWIIAITVAKFLNPVISGFVKNSVIGEAINKNFNETSQAIIPAEISWLVTDTGEELASGMADVVIDALSFLIVVIITYIIANLLVKSLNLVAKLPMISFVNRTLGLITGFVIGVIIVYGLLAVVEIFDISECKELIDMSVVAYTMYRHNIFANFIF